MKPLILALVLVLTPSFCQAQNSDDLRRGYSAIYAALFDSPSVANDTIHIVDLYVSNTPFKYETVLSSVQKVLAARLTAKARREVQVARLIVPCGDAAIGVDGSDFAFAECVQIIDELSMSSGAENYVLLCRLDALGIPVFRFIAVGIGRPVDAVKALSFQGRLKSTVLAQLLLESLKSSYGGLAEKAKHPA